MGAWIEITTNRRDIICGVVAPLVGAWIEIFDIDYFKYVLLVAPLVGAWIEIGFDGDQNTVNDCRSSRGSVD